MKNFSLVNENDKITVKLIGQKFELNDKYISVIDVIILNNKININI